MTDVEIIAREVSGYRVRLERLEARLLEVEHVNARLESAALTTSRSLSEISRHWDALYESMRRPERISPDGNDRDDTSRGKA